MGQATRGMTTKPTILWLRQDLRLHDNPALHWAAARGAVVPVYIFDTALPASAKMGGASRWWLHHALTDLANAFQKIGGTLILRQGDPEKIIRELIRETGADAVTWNRCYEPHAIARDTRIKSALQEQSVEVASHNGSLLVEPWVVKTKTGTPFKVYTPFSKACMGMDFGKPVPAPAKLTLSPSIASDALNNWALLPTAPDWSGGMVAAWQPTVKAANELLDEFINTLLADYKTARDRPDKTATSRLSPYLHFGQISPRAVWQRITTALAQHPEQSAGGECYMRELLWREFSYHLLYQFPQLPTKPFNPRFAAFPWRDDDAALHAWQRGQTGYPIVDAGMRQLWQTGWMHNRVRMVVASFLVKHLLIPWQAGEAWFWDTLVDADLASNAASWQWVAGCGADAAPYFRIFNPMMQGEKFDPDGNYVRQFVPELAKLDAEYIHAPWEAPPDVLHRAGVVLGKNYPAPIVDHAAARARALAALKEIAQ